MNILVTGGAGYIGSATANALLQAGHLVTVYDNLSNGHADAVPSDARFVYADLMDREAIVDVLGGEVFDAVLHFAASIEPAESMRDPGKFYTNNVAASIQLAETAVQAGVRRFVFSSTAAVYKSSDERLSEDSTIEPSNVYGQTKRTVEEMLEWYRRIHGLHYAALRYFNAAGAVAGHGEDHRPEPHLIPQVLQVALGKRPRVEIYGTDYPTPDGTCIRDYIHLTDLVAAHTLALEALEEKDGLIYNVGNGEGWSVRQVIETAREVTGHPIPVNEAPRRPGDPPWLVASAKKIKQELGWQPRFPDLRDIIASAWDWHRKHPEGYEA